MLLIFFIHSFPVFPVLYYIPLDQRNKKKERKKKKKEIGTIPIKFYTQKK